MPYKASFEEDGFLRQIGVEPEEAEPLADNCSLVLVWHTQTYNSYRLASFGGNFMEDFFFITGSGSDWTSPAWKTLIFLVS